MQKVRATLYNHTQATPSTTWTVNHNLSGNGSSGIPIVDVVVDKDGTKTKMIPLEVTIVDKDNITISFSVAQSGSAMILI